MKHIGIINVCILVEMVIYSSLLQLQAEKSNSFILFTLLYSSGGHLVCNAPFIFKKGGSGALEHAIYLHDHGVCCQQNQFCPLKKPKGHCQGKHTSSQQSFVFIYNDL